MSAADKLAEALAALVLNIDAGGATLGAMRDARAALAAYEAEAKPAPAEPVDPTTADHLKKHLTTYATKHPSLLVRQLASMLAAAPAAPSPVPLTLTRIAELWGDRSDGPSLGELVSFTRAVERAHGIGKGGAA